MAFEKAACVVLLRPKSGKLPDVYLVERARELAFLGGFFAFPGGTTHPVDLSINNAVSSVSTALRELFEETGILLTSPEHTTTVEERRRWRRSLLDDPQIWQQIVTEARIDLSSPTITHLSTWLTPPYSKSRYHTPYYAAWTPDDQQPEIWPGELSTGLWIDAAEAVQRFDQGALPISWPVLETLRSLVTENGDITRAATTLLARGDSAYPFGGGEILPGIHIVPVKTPTLPPATHTNCYILGRHELVVVDPATPDPDEQQRIFDYLRHLQSRGGVLRAIYLTHHHLDHVGAANQLRAQFHVPIRAHRDTAQKLLDIVDVDEYVKDEQVFELNIDPAPRARWQILDTPGHCSGHLCFYDLTSQTLLTGDVVVGMGSVLVAPPDGNMQAYMQTLQRLRQLPLRFLLPAHGPPIGAAHAKIDHYIQHRRQREEAIAQAFAVPRSVDDILPIVYADVEETLWPLAKLSIVAHIEKLLHENRLVEQDGRYCLRD